MDMFLGSFTQTIGNVSLNIALAPNFSIFLVSYMNVLILIMGSMLFRLLHHLHDFYESKFVNMNFN